MRYLSTTRISDRDLNTAFNTASFSTILSRGPFATDESKRECLRLQQAGAIPLADTFSNLLRMGSMFHQLQHPLLKRYEFEPVAFLAGAREAFTKVNLACSSQEFMQHCNGHSAPPPPTASPPRDYPHDLLQDTIVPELYSALTEAARMIRIGQSVALVDVDISDATLREITISIVPGDVPVGTEYLTDEQREADAEERAKTAAEGGEWAKIWAQERLNADEIWAQKNAADGSNGGPPGSVVVYVEVQFCAHQKYINNAGSEPGSAFSTTKVHTWGFQGCISGQSELEWRITFMSDKRGLWPQV
eukprot:CAMPEP_0173204922 /NCGR_PEP_ID=MMETSP1141-20130122/20425_1 /TAXON_ID=483371 /ORGANISM="non described non described, Strain CCMP2298" /LENGTH=303 /DNA_ID=CAMNT_0014130707 /DNA_START=188 /DNA_END=1099 /DNA_ORIENTATION=+